MSRNGPERGGGEAGRCFELIREMLHATVTEFVRDFTEGQFAVLEKLFCELDALEDDELFDSDIFDG